jgi:flagellar biosynthetic protein FliQ
MEAELVALATQTFKVTFYLAFPILIGSLIAGLFVSIFQATTQINEMTLTFVPKIIVVVVIMIFLMPWMTSTIVDFTKEVFNKIPTFIG